MRAAGDHGRASAPPKAITITLRNLTTLSAGALVGAGVVALVVRMPTGWTVAAVAVAYIVAVFGGVVFLKLDGTSPDQVVPAQDAPPPSDSQVQQAMYVPSGQTGPRTSTNGVDLPPLPGQTDGATKVLPLAPTAGSPPAAAVVAGDRDTPPAPSGGSGWWTKPARRSAGAPPPEAAPTAAPPLAGYATRIAQCPKCGSFRLDHRETAEGTFQFHCRAHGHQWTWVRGTPWPTTAMARDPRATDRPRN